MAVHNVLSSLLLLQAAAFQVLLFHTLLTTAFPESQNPFSAGPHISAPQNDGCHLQLFDNATLNTYSQLSRFPFDTPPCWQDDESTMKGRVVLHVHGSVKGVQYDRAGALWVNGVSVLRMTTPEPTRDGIAWNIERDVTTYATLFRNGGQVQVQIPNNVNNVYTGVIYLSAHVVFYPDKDNISQQQPAMMADHVQSLAHPTKHNDAWSAMAIRGGGKSHPAQTLNFTLPSKRKRKSIARAHIDLYASAHACEEFWYTNPPPNTDNGCGGGSTRAIQLKVDGRVAGIQLPFPVIYTGGINPLLWRPQTGIYSFHIPPYFFDITPLLQDDDGPATTHTLQVKILGNSAQGEWNVDPVLVIYYDDDDNDGDDAARLDNQEAVTPPRTSIDRYEFVLRGPTVTIINATNDDGNNKTNITWIETLEAELTIETGNSNITSKLSSSITNQLLGDSLQVTSASLNTWMNSSSYNRTEAMEYPLNVTTEYRTDNHSFFIQASVQQGLRHAITSSMQSSPSSESSTIIYQDQIAANATYSRSTTPDRTVYEQRGASAQHTTLSVPNNKTNCFRQQIHAKNGFVTAFQEEESSCGNMFCAQFDTCSPKIVNATRTSNKKARTRPYELREYHLDLLVRHPRSQFALQEPPSWEMQQRQQIGSVSD
ncbi:Peptide N-acetyl-beta-D-glucosaminyl asparaginase amidase A [Seminavis robusta]|uniref:Peptide N-acetyl-beta-D-glucosaminyl asparaginase amidase A n=1 Tax=Seminavis robusta TaxID=568900 RepID=A0A9N8HHG3_9STRA|nr:Peptide N-acetyl-beta-D-glucosaminyl asparaginase amidase A [Seminavis robusta]|eukprot:Sro634_g178980.1 Peptide N-acetyl-beta-D-glucosaminyl asparaginase amidase A (654) ;mRNA; f:21111-23072